MSLGIGVIGAGIMGGGIAYQSAVKGTPIIMKDIRSEALDLGMNEAGDLFGAALTSGDFNNDGRPDLFLSGIGGPRRLLRNDGPAGADRTPRAACSSSTPSSRSRRRVAASWRGAVSAWSHQ